MPKVAILYMDRYSGYECDHEIVRSITDWKEVTPEERDALRHYLDKVPHPRDMRALLLEQMDDSLFPTTLAKALVAVERYKNEEAERKAKWDAARAKTLATKSEKERQKYEELKARFEK